MRWGYRGVIIHLVPKVNVYVSDELLARVRDEEIAVSPVCQQALAAEVGARRLARSASKNMRAVAKRLRQTENARQEQLYQDGYEFGMAWAQKVAALEELRLVDRVADRGMTVQLSRIPTYVGHLLDANPDLDVVLDEFLDGEKSEFDHGVLAGAAAVYREVRPLLEGSSRGGR